MKRLFICFVTLAILITCGGAIFAADSFAPVPEPGSPQEKTLQPPVEPPPSTRNTTGATTTAPHADVAQPPPSSDVQHPPMVPVPQGEVPSPVRPSEPPSGYMLPPTAPIPVQPGNFINFTADEVRAVMDNGVVVETIATGNVTARYRDMMITSNAGHVDYRTNIATFEGNVVFRISVQDVRGERLQINLKTREWTFTPASTTIRPEFSQGLLQAPIFIRGGSVAGVGTRRVDAYSVEATTCNKPRPDYDFIAQSMTVYPDDKIVLRDVTFYMWGHKILTLPRFVLPLRQIRRNPNLIPRIGQNAEEGFFLKTAYSYMGTQYTMGFLLLDLMSRKGIGTGIRQTYNLPKAVGELNLYHLYDETLKQNLISGRFVHTQQMGTINGNLTANYRTNSYFYAPQSTTLDGRLVLTRNRPGAISSFVLGQNTNEVFTRSSNLTGNLQHLQQFGNRTSFNSNFDYISFTTAGQTQARLTSDLELLRREDKFDWTLTADKITDLSDEAFAGTGVFAGIERLPELGLVTDNTRLGGLLPFGLPARLRMSYGNYTELPGNIDRGRAYFNIESPTQRHNFTDTWSLGAGGGFRQYAYSDGTAQYSYDVNAIISKRLAENSNLDFIYRNQTPRGFTPFRFDFIGKYNTLNTNLNIRQGDRFRLSLLGGYNFEQSQFPWQDTVLRFAIQPTCSFMFYTATGYNFNRGQWRTFINQIRVRAANDFRLDIGTRYDPTRGQLGAVRGLLDTPLGKDYRLQALAGYNGITKEFDYRGLRLTRDLHCMEASISYLDQGGFYLNRGVWLTIRIKAFPLWENFGAGPFGQALDTSVGQVY